MGKYKKFNAREKALITKDIRQGMKIPVKTYEKIKNELLKKYDIKGFQALFDYLVVSGVVYLKKDVIEIIRSRKQEYIERYRQEKLSKFGRAPKPIVEPVKQIVCMMYEKDAFALNNFVIEEKDIKKFWIFEILMDEFAKENPVLIEHIKNCQKLKVNERKKQLSRLMNDEYVIVLHPKDQETILDMLTKKYDEREQGLLQHEVLEALSEEEKKDMEENDFDAAFASRITRLRNARAAAREGILKPVIDDDPAP